MAQKNFTVIDGTYEDFEHPMSGYGGVYNTLRVDISIRKYDNGKFTAYVEEQMYVGDIEDEGEFNECDKEEIRNTHESPEFDNKDDAYEWVETTDVIDWNPE